MSSWPHCTAPLTIKWYIKERHLTRNFYRITVVISRTLSGWPLRDHMVHPYDMDFKSILWKTLFLGLLHDFSSLSLNSFENQFLNKKPWGSKKHTVCLHTCHVWLIGRLRVKDLWCQADKFGRKFINYIMNIIFLWISVRLCEQSSFASA